MRLAISSRSMRSSLRSLVLGGKKSTLALPRQAANSAQVTWVTAMVSAPCIDLSPQVNHLARPWQGPVFFLYEPHFIAISLSATLRYVAHVLLASDLLSLRRELRDMLEGPELTIEEASSGFEVLARVREGGVDLVIVDLQIGTMGGMAICLELRNEESYGAAEPVSVLMLLDRRPDVFLARRSGAEGFVVKPLDPQRMRGAVRALLRGETYEDESLRPATVRAVPSI